MHSLFGNMPIHHINTCSIPAVSHTLGFLCPGPKCQFAVSSLWEEPSQQTYHSENSGPCVMETKQWSWIDLSIQKNKDKVQKKRTLSHCPIDNLMDKGGTPLSIYLQWKFIMVEQFGPRLPKVGYMMVLLGPGKLEKQTFSKRMG